MIPTKSGEELVEIAQKLKNEGKKGFLLSGGCDVKGRVPLWNVVEDVHAIKLQSPMRINAHTGLVYTEELARIYAASNIDVFSVDVIGSEETLQEIYNADVHVRDYEKTIENLLRSGATVVPHVTIGINYGRESGEENAIDIVSRYPVSKLVLNVLVPVSGTPMENIHVPVERIEHVFQYARDRVKTEIVLGCMRERKPEIEMLAYKNGFAGVARPTREFVEYLKKSGEEILIRDYCCCFQ
jgi:uncharacterized radical SAM superfamily protein